uniref:Uncharacterized protein n=1 Tax=Oryza barthii TaxID=65489 RepID=A0A0D3HSZ5_9ORYZ
MSRSPSPDPYKNKSEEEEEEEEESPPSRSGGLMLRTLPGWGKGILSCFHEKMRPPIDEAGFHGQGYMNAAEDIEKYYVAASERLPLEEIPDLVGCINVGGLCVGLADPVTNIILNAIALLQQPSPPSQNQNQNQLKTKKIYRWFPIATKSYDSLCAFMTAYFNYLSRTQAQRYLYLACQDLALAINLVHYDHFPSYSQEQQRCLLSDGGLIKVALRAAALQARHPAPDVLAGLMTAQYPAHLLSPILARLQNNNTMLSPINVREIKDLLAHQWPGYPSPTNIGFRCRPDGITCIPSRNGGCLIQDCLEDGIVACISISRVQPSQQQLYLSQLTFQDEGIDARLSSCLIGPVIAKLQEQDDEIEVNYDDHPCEHILSLRMCLLKTIHSFYIKALAKLPSSTRSARLFRALLVAGHCYGPMDPVSNIILSTIWYDIAFGADVGIPQGMFSTRPLSRMVSRSLDGLVAISSLTTCESEHEALYNINSLGCDLSTYLFDTVDDESLSSTQETAVSNSVLFAAAAKAAKHPQHEAFVSFVKSLSAKKLIFLRHLLDKPSSRILSHDWDKLNSFLRSVMPFSTRNDMDAQRTLFSFASLEMFHPSAPLVMAPSASQMMSRDKQAIVCTELNKMLDEYCYQHPWEPSYKLDVVCGVMQSSRCAYYGNSTLYHANFLASSDDECKVVALFVRVK